MVDVRELVGRLSDRVSSVTSTPINLTMPTGSESTGAMARSARLRLERYQGCSKTRVDMVIRISMRMELRSSNFRTEDTL